MSDRRRHGGEDFRIAGMKNSMTNVAPISHSIPRAGNDLQQQFSREDAPVKTSEYLNLQLINMVRENPVLYDEEYQASIPDAQLRIQRRETWDRIRADICWQETCIIEDVWIDLLDQYARKVPGLTDAMMEAMRWTDPLIHKKKFPIDSRPPSQLNPMSSALDKDYYHDVPLTEDVLEPEQNIGNTTQSLKYNYVVIQPSVGHVRPNSHQTIQPNTHTASSFSRRKSPSPRPTEAIVVSYPLSPKRKNHRMPNQHPQEPNQLHDPKKEGAPMGYSTRSDVLVEVEPSSSYQTSNTKMYKIVTTQRNSAPQGVAQRKLMQQPPHRSSSLRYDNTMPDQIIEPPRIVEPPKKKMIIDSMGIHRNSGPTSSNMNKHHIESGMNETKVLTDGVPLAGDEIILGTDGECKLGPAGLIMDPTLPSTSQPHGINSGQDDMHHYDLDHFEDDNEVVVEEEIEQQPISTGHDLTIQYDEDLAFQQHINSVLNRLQDDDKALLKFNMQRIILDARFGEGTAKQVCHGEIVLTGVGSSHQALSSHQSHSVHVDNDHGIEEPL
ncbi:unnamed protein product [Caenorhabditis brenneri]